MNSDIKIVFDDTQDINTTIDVGSIQYGQLEIGTTTTGETGEPAKVTNSGSSSHAILNFTIPRGERGEQGVQGEKGEKGERGIQGESGVYIGENEPTNANVWIDPTGEGTLITLTQAEYDDLDTKNDNTYYFIIEEE